MCIGDRNYPSMVGGSPVSQTQSSLQELISSIDGAFARFHVPNKKVAVEPFPEGEKKAEVKGRVLVPMNQGALTPLRVVFSNGDLAEGHVVYVRSNLPSTTTYGKTVYEIEKRKFILVPEDEVVLVDYRPSLPSSEAK